MGVDYDAELIIGCRIDFKKLKKLVIDFEKKNDNDFNEKDLDIDLNTIEEITGKKLFIKT